MSLSQRYPGEIMPLAGKPASRDYLSDPAARQRIAGNLRHLRLERGWTQDELGRRLGYANGRHIGTIEQGKAVPRAILRRRLADALGASEQRLTGPWKPAAGAASIPGPDVPPDLAERHPDVTEPVKAVWLSGKHGTGRYVIVDPGDYEVAREFRWTVHHVTANASRQESVYAFVPGLKGPRGARMPLTRLLTGWQVTGHKNGNPLDCRRSNLIKLNPSLQQASQSKKRKDHETASRFKGVQRTGKKARRDWRALIRYEGKLYYLGSFYDEKDAAMAYDEKLLELVGPEGAEYAMTNERLGLFEEKA